MEAPWLVIPPAQVKGSEIAAPSPSPCLTVTEREHTGIHKMELKAN